MSKNLLNAFRSSFLALSLAGTVFVAVPGKALELSLQEAQRRGLENSEALKMKLNEVERRDAQVREALGSALPQISAEARWQKYFKSPVFFGSPVPIEYQFESGISVQQVVWAFGRVSSALNAAKAGLKAGRLDKDITQADVSYQVTLAYYTALLAQEQLRISEQTLQNAKENLSILQKKFAGGRAPQGDLVRLRSDVAVRTSQFQTAKAEYKQALLTLAQLVGAAESEELRLTEKFKTRFEDLNAQNLQDELLENQPRLEALEEQIKYNKELADIQKAGSLPVLSVFGSYNYSGASDKADIGSENLYESTVGGVALTWNLWDGGQNNAKYRQAVVDKANAELALIQGRERLQLNLAKALETYQSLTASYPSSVEAVKLAEQSFRISQKRFQTGQASVTEINSTEAALTQARLGLALDTFNIHATLAEITNLTLAENVESQNL